MVAMPRAIDEDLSRRGGPSLTRYGVLTKLSEAPGRALRMSELAEAAASSPSRLARIIQPMVADGLVTREAAADDGRASVVALTDEGLDRLAQAWPAHLAGVRALVIDHIDPAELADFSPGYGAVLAAITKGCAEEWRDQISTYFFRKSGVPDAHGRPIH